MQSIITAVKEASICVRKGYRVQSGESVLVLADGGHMTEALALAAAANAAGAKVALMDISSIVAEGLLVPGIPEPPKHVSAAVKNSDVIIIKTEIDYAHRFAHTTTVREAVDNKVKIASVEEGLGSWGLTDEDIDKVEKRTDSLIKRFKGADKIHVTSNQGTDITLSIRGRPALKVTPVRIPGVMMGPMPLWGEAAYAAIEGSANGQIVMDGVMNVVAPYGMKTNITVKIKDGRAQEITGAEEAQKLREILAAADEGADMLAEFSLGSGHLVKFGTLSEKGKLGTIHFALGDNHHAYPGGKNVSKWHLDATVRYPTVEVDGKTIIKDGVWTFEKS
ncbi:MAG: aminopeptidase [Thaumarchaeota archaeon]|nr:aminopeptidase [Nitrososphaerota archaeon]